METTPLRGGIVEVMVLLYCTTVLIEPPIHSYSCECGEHFTADSLSHRRGRLLGASSFLHKHSLLYNVYKYFDEWFSDTPIQDIVKMIFEATEVSQSLVIKADGKAGVELSHHHHVRKGDPLH